MFAVTALVLSAPVVEAQSTEVADAMTTVNCSALGWTRYCERAFALHIGVPEQRLKSAVPGFDWPALPKAIESLMSGDPAALEQLAVLLKDTRATQVSGDDMLEQPNKESRLTVADLADSLAGWLVPLGNVRAKNGDQARALMEEQVLPWLKRLSSLKPEQRLAAWFSEAANEQRRMALAFLIATDHAPAWPLIEESLLKRAQEEPELGFVILEAAAYVRHRKHEAAAFLDRLRHALKPGEMSEVLDAVLVVRNGKSMLTEPFTAEQRVQQFLNGALTLDDLSEWAVRSIDQPWAYHSLGIEPVSVHVQPMNQCLAAAISGAASTDDLGKRLQLLRLANSFAYNLNDIMGNARKDELPATSGPRDASLAKMTTALKSLLADKREVFDVMSLTSPADLAAQCVWDLWGANTRQLDSLFHDAPRDWRVLAYGFPQLHAQLLIEAAEDILNDTRTMKPEPFPEQEARELFAGLAKASADERSARFKVLTWQQKLMVSELASKDEAVARNLWPRMRRWKTLSDTNALPESFQQLWTTACDGKSLDAASFAALKGWIMNEATDGRFWVIFAESSAYSDGLTLHLCAQRNVKQHTRLLLSAHLTGTRFYSTREEWQYAGKKWSEMKMPYKSDDPAISAILTRLDEYIPADDEKKARVGVLALTLACENAEK